MKKTSGQEPLLRRRRLMAVAAGVFLLSSAFCRPLAADALLTERCSESVGVRDKVEITTSPAGIMLGFYEKWLAPVLGGRCPMHPSCSQYSRQACERHGPIFGWIMTCDRLLRCGRDETFLAPRVIVNNHAYSHDPLEDNDAWWRKE